MIASVVVVFPECLLPTTAITGIPGSDVMECSRLFVWFSNVFDVWNKCVLWGLDLAVCG